MNCRSEIPLRSGGEARTRRGVLPALRRAAPGRPEREIAAERRFGAGAGSSCRLQAWAASVTAVWSQGLSRSGRELFWRPSSCPKQRAASIKSTAQVGAGCAVEPHLVEQLLAQVFGPGTGAGEVQREDQVRVFSWIVARVEKLFPSPGSP
jgi:hypothetical protein